MSNKQALRDLVVERLVVAADEIYALFEQTFSEYQAVVRTKLLQDHKYHVEETNEELPHEDVQTLMVQTEVKSIKFEEEEVPLNFQSIPDDMDKLTFNAQDPAKEYGQDTVQEEHGVDEPGCSLNLEEFAPCSFSDTDDSDDWEPQPKKKRKSRKNKSFPSVNQTNGKKEFPANVVPDEREPLKTNVCNPPFISAKVSCSLCHNVFSGNQYLNQHVRIHTREKPFHCEPCSISFRFRQNQHRHNLAVHPNENLHRCLVCNKDFADISELIVHKETHKDKPPIKCLNCNETFMCIKSLMSHKMSQQCV